jgi:glycosyltransferase involved in cell wall biosynthesis
MNDVPNVPQVVVLIPAFNPGSSLLETVEGLAGLGFRDFVVINDGSQPESECVFDRLAAREGCVVLRHAINLGKGRALKTGLNHFLIEFPDHCGVVTVDADGQHTAPDAAAIARVLSERPRQLILGARTFSGRVPLRSLAGNVITRHLLGVLTGRRLRDTQSGLRGIPRAAAGMLLRLEGERYEYEMNMLLEAPREGFGIFEAPISTVYLEGNRSSHFNPLRDSMRIYFVLLRFSFSSLLTAAVDTLGFAIGYQLTGRVLGSLLAARLASSLVNFFLNKEFVFHSPVALATSLLKYYVLVGFMALLSYLLITELAERLGVPVILAKVAVDTGLWLATFALQRIFIFAVPTEE